MAANVQKLDLVDIDLSKEHIHRNWANHAIGLVDNKADAFGVRVFRDGEPVTLTGISVQGYFRDPHGNNIPIINGTNWSANTVSGNMAYVVLPQACYAYEGQFCLAIKLVGGGVTGTMRIVDGMVNNTNTTGAIEPAPAVATYDEVLAGFEQAMAVIDASVRYDIDQTSKTALAKAQARNNIESAYAIDIAEVYSTSGKGGNAYVAGALVLDPVYKTLYRLKQAVPVGTAWSTSLGDKVNLSDHFTGETTALLSEFNNFESFTIRKFYASDKYEKGDLVYQNNKVYAYLREKPAGTSFYADAVYEVKHLSELYRSSMALSYAKKVYVFDGKITPASTNNFRCIPPVTDGTAGKLCLYMMISTDDTMPNGYRIISDSASKQPFGGGQSLHINKAYIAPLVSDYTTRMFGPYLNSTDTADSDGGNFTFIFAYDIEGTPTGAIAEMISTYAVTDKLFGNKLSGVFNLLAGNRDARMVNPTALKAKYGQTVKFLIECDDDAARFDIMTGDNIKITDTAEKFKPNIIYTRTLNIAISDTISTIFGPYIVTAPASNLFIRFTIWYDLPESYTNASNNILPTVRYPNAFDKNNTNLIIPDTAVDGNGDLYERTGFSVLKIPVSGIDGNEYNVYTPNSAGTGFVPMSARFVMFAGDGSKIGVLVDGSKDPAVVNNKNCRFLYTTVGSSYIPDGRAMVLINTGGAEFPIWDKIPYGSHTITDLHLYNKAWASYGDSISALNNGNFLGKGWGKYVNYEYGFGESYGRSVGGQSFKWGTGGGSTVFVKTDDGEYYDRVETPLDDYTGEVPEGCTAVRGCMCSWLRIKTMFPDDIKDNINMVFIMAGSNDTYTANETLSWIANDTTDPEWASSDEYETYGGDYNISTTIGAVASTVMKFQAWMPNAIIILGTPLNGNTESGIMPGYIPDEYYKGQYIKTVADIFGIPCIDVYGTCGINVLNTTDYITDGIHPYSEAGCKMLARAVIGGLKTIYPHIE